MEQPMDQNQTPQSGNSDAEKNKALAIIGYIFPILFFIPLITDAKNSPFAKFHANQQLDLLLFYVAGYIVASILSFLLIGLILFPILWIASLVFMILGIINASKGEMKTLPIIGGIHLIK